jgi:hypothetical protein
MEDWSIRYRTVKSESDATLGGARCFGTILTDSSSSFLLQFAHGKAELREVQRHPKYKTEVSSTYTKSSKDFEIASSEQTGGGPFDSLGFVSFLTRS